MIIKAENNIELEGQISSDDIEATISKENLPFIIDLLSKTQYKNPIGSIIRELTSNAFDAHIEAGVNFPVYVNFKQDELGQYISIVDQGIGMSPERIKNVYLSYGESTRRKDNKTIGGFGIGGKSPLSYNNHYYVTTIYEGVTSEYIVHEGKVLPTMTLIDQYEVTERNGTTIKIYFKTDDDRYTFINEAKNQLLYFDNVILYPDYLFNNKYQIYEGKHFKVRSDINDLSNQSVGKYMHICIGKVFYPIDYNNLNIKPIPIPVALKFDIGELQVTPERESIRYIQVEGKETTNIIKDKIELVYKELLELYNKQDLVFHNIIDFMKEYREDAILKIEDQVSLNLASITKNNCSFPPLKDYLGDLKYLDQLFHFNRCSIKEGTTTVRWKYVGYNGLIYHNGYLTKYEKPKLNKKNYILSSRNLDKFELLKYNIVSKKTLYRQARLPIRLPYNTNVIKQLELVERVLREEFDKLYPSYDSLVMPTDVKKSIKVSIKKDDEIIAYNLAYARITDRKQYIKVSFLEKFTGFIIYGFEEDEEQLLNIEQVLEKSRYNTNGHYPEASEAYRVYKISKKYSSYFINKKNVCYIKNFMGNNTIFKNIATAYIIREETLINDIVRKYIHLINPDIEDKIKLIDNFINDFDYQDIGDSLRKTIINFAKENNLIKESIFEIHLLVNKYLKDLHLVNFIFDYNFSSNVGLALLDYFIIKGKEVSILWTKPLRYELELMKDSFSKLNYLRDIADAMYRPYGFDSKKKDYSFNIEIYQSFVNQHKLCKQV